MKAWNFIDDWVQSSSRGSWPALEFSIGWDDRAFEILLGETALFHWDFYPCPILLEALLGSSKTIYLAGLAKYLPFKMFDGYRVWTRLKMNNQTWWSFDPFDIPHTARAFAPHQRAGPPTVLSSEQRELWLRYGMTRWATEDQWYDDFLIICKTLPLLTLLLSEFTAAKISSCRKGGLRNDLKGSRIHISRCFESDAAWCWDKDEDNTYLIVSVGSHLSVWQIKLITNWPMGCCWHKNGPIGNEIQFWSVHPMMKSIQ